ncbi:serine hydrolase domain-containing protein [Maribellus maritimus]|uniref:serine hydrolase domain-containing protein n=1 Tax=Maribellus maritimus TaxID=2870838 RepID=UPI001EEC8CD7|nr:serine hydrolase domain-containing protein [Maribellus maritimus]MCG6186290.1 beta-lactamase family protein [Maribellus maritimus]
MMKKTPAIVTILLITAQSVFCQLTLENAAKIDSVAQKLHKEGKFNGGLLVAEGNQIIYENAFGLADRNLNIPNSHEMRFWDASIGKMFTAVLILQLAEEDKLFLTDPISKHLPWFRHELADSISIHQLLSHRSGFQSRIYEEREIAEHDEKSQRSILEHKIAKSDLAFEPGAAFLYSNTGYVLLSEVIMAHLGKDYNAILQEHIFKPLKMNETYWSAPIYGPTMPVYYLEDGNAFLPADELDFTGPGGEKTTLRDLHKFMLAVGTDQLISKKSWALAFKAHSLPEEAKSQWGPHQSPYGYGFSLIDLPYASNEIDATVSHGGAGKGTSSYALRFLEKNRIVILWNNEYKNPMLFELYMVLSELSK